MTIFSNLFPSIGIETERGSERNGALDAVKGLMIILMVYGHVTHTGSLKAIQDVVVVWIYTFHMPVFLLLSGYFFASRLRDKPILRPVWRRLIIPYLIFEAVYLCGLWGARSIGLPTNNTPPAADFLNLLRTEFLHPIGAYWFIHALIVVQLSLALARRVATTSASPVFSVWTVAALVLGSAVSLGLLRDIAAVYFSVGLLIAVTGASVLGNLRIALPGLVMCLAVRRGAPVELALLQLGWVLSITAILSVLFIRAPEKVTGTFAWFGRNTLSIVVLHALFIVALKPAARLFNAIDPSGLLHSAISVIAALAGCLALARVFDLLGLSRPLFGSQALYSRRRPPQ